ncbi:amino acid permease [Spiroplasma chinense]|uniref:Amino acid permease n=1 Tax=Spiroplasma chinense TaxID=216932 RepID=A0A5B9Y6C4_9MOLU|nr:APC family permease [Spiroplasma chinense]QEH62395.1 amino acid permease [Spiroplasma chinense]
MINVNKKNKSRNRIFEFLAIFSMAFGLVVGSGIYLKNRSEPGSGGVLDAANNNPYLAIVVWIFIGLICTLMMISFLEISSAIDKDDHNTVQSWSAKFINKKSASMFSIFYVAFYMPILGSLGAMFLVDVLFEQGMQTFARAAYGVDNSLAMFKSNHLGWYITLKIILSSILLISFQVMNTFTSKPSKLIQTTFTFVKFIPLLAVIIGGFAVFFLGNKNGNSFDAAQSDWKVPTFFSTAIPILFAFDGFIYATTLQKDVEHKQVVEPAMLAAIIAVTLFYIIITVSIFIGANDGDIFNLFDTVFSKVPALSLIFKLIISSTLLTIVNGYTTLIPKTIESASHEGFVYFGKRSKTLSHKEASIIGAIITQILFFVTIAASLSIQSITAEPSHMIIADSLSSTTVLYAFVIYTVLIFGQVINRKTKKVQVKEVKGAFVTGIITLCLLLVIIPYVLYQCLIDVYIQKNVSGMIVSISSFVVLIPIAVWYFINKSLLQKYGE